jgi:Uma2 family endonuclease
MTKPLSARPFTYTDYLQLPGEERYEIISGELFLAPAPGERHQAVSRNLGFLLWQHVRERKLGEVYYAPLDVVLSDTDVVQPDLVFVSEERRHLIRAEGLFGAPDLVVEILSPATRERDLGPKMHLYFRSGVREYWVVDPEEQAVLVYLPGGFALHGRFRPGQPLSSPLLPGFAPDPRELFA